MTGPGKNLILVPFADLELARRLERAEAVANAQFVEARAALEPGRGAAWVEIAGAYAMFDGINSPVTQTFGLGLFADPTARDFDAIEDFFRDRSAPVYHEVSPLASAATLELLTSRGYEPFEFTSVLYRVIDPAAERFVSGLPSSIHVREAAPDEAERWAAIGAEGWSDTPELSAFVAEIGRVIAARRGTILYFAEIRGEPIAAAALSLHEDVALLAGASTVPRARGRGAQNALLDARLQAGQRRGCTIATMGALPGSGSQRNAERNGFRVAYTRIKWRLASARPAHA